MTMPMSTCTVNQLNQHHIVVMCWYHVNRSVLKSTRKQLQWQGSWTESGRLFHAFRLEMAKGWRPCVL